MSLREKLIILCAPLIVLIEWAGFAYVNAQYTMNFNEPISATPYFHPEFATFFGIWLTVIAVLFSIFTLALRPYWKEAFKMSLFCGVLIIIAGWVQYSPEGGTSSAIHAGTANIATLGYTFILLQVSLRAHGILRRAGLIFARIAGINIIAVLISVNILHVNSTWFQLLLGMTVQAWALYTAYYLWTKKEPATQ